MSRLDDLVHKLCPNGVHYYTVDELIKNKIIVLISPIYKIKQKEYLEIGSTPIISQEAEYVSGYTNLKDPRLPNDEYVCFGDHTEHLKYVDFEFVQGADGLKVMHIENKEVLNTKFYYYVCSSYYLKKNTYERHFKHLRECLLPLPPLEVQQEIVRLLDDFTAKTAELQTELNKEYEACKKQYEYYQNLLLNDKFGAEYKELGDVVTFLNGRAYKQSELLNSGKYKVLRVGNFYTNNQWYYSDLELEQNKYCQKGDLLYTWAATIGPQIWDGEKVIYHYHIWKLVFDNSILNMHYLYHYLKKDINDISNSLTNSTMPHVSMSSMKKRMISIPPMETQQEIVRLLDNLTEKTEELQDKLNEELKSRQKQYEYYRDKLLTFKELTESEVN